MYNFQSVNTVYTRVSLLTAPDGVVGHAYDSLKEACFSPWAEGNLLLVRYDSLANNPGRVLGEIYKFLGEEPFPHDFEDVHLDETGYDRKAGTPGLHEVRGTVEALERKMMLPPDLVQRFQGASFWREGVPGVRCL